MPDCKEEFQNILFFPIEFFSKDNYEMGFVIQIYDSIVPIEVKTGINVRSKNMTKILKNMDMGIRVSMKNLKHTSGARQ
ncbi:MAG: hypothetical protein U9Q80_03275 [Bacillota bacterium]|nr:hypothetical protein [Bacillota bacterium]